MFAVTLPDKQAWRALPDFPSATCYLDIETDGGHAGDSVTVIGCYDGSTFDAFVRGENLESFRDYISRFSVIVTFFGTGFDLPMLRRRFPDIRWDQIHVDLCTAGRRIGYRGGLKAIEHTLGIQRSSETVGLTGFDAVRLWRSYQRGSDSALDQLVAYNREDTVNLKVLAEKFYPKLRDQTLSGELAPRAMRRNAKLAR